MLDPMMNLAAHQSTQNYKLLDAVSRNVGNLNTWGYKAQRFELYLDPTGGTSTTRRVDYKPGEHYLTQRELDVSIDGHGFFQVTRPDGTTAYTRNGSFALNEKGFLITDHGDLVGSGIQIPARYEELHIKPDGKVMLRATKGGDLKEIGHIPLVSFNNEEGLENVGFNLLAETKDSGPPQKIEDHKKLKQGYLEQANVNVHYAVADVLRLNAGVISNLRIIKAIDEIYREAINLRQ